MHPFSSGSFTTRRLTFPIRLPILAHARNYHYGFALTREFYDIVTPLITMVVGISPSFSASARKITS